LRQRCQEAALILVGVRVEVNQGRFALHESLLGASSLSLQD
jgi:hypothetical protein